MDKMKVDTSPPHFPDITSSSRRSSWGFPALHDLTAESFVHGDAAEKEEWTEKTVHQWMYCICMDVFGKYATHYKHGPL